MTCVNMEGVEWFCDARSLARCHLDAVPRVTHVSGTLFCTCVCWGNCTDDLCRLACAPLSRATAVIISGYTYCDAVYAFSRYALAGCWDAGVCGMHRLDLEKSCFRFDSIGTNMNMANIRSPTMTSYRGALPANFPTRWLLEPT